MKLSLIIPVYNVEKYVEKCLLSCVKQDISHNDYEIIVVNDGSPDNSLAIVERIAKDYSNIRIINQENQGLSCARNTGMMYAKGEYIWFVDSDDYIENNILKNILDYLTDNLDILQLKYRLVYEKDNSFEDVEKKSLVGVQTGKKVISECGINAPAQFSIFRKQFLKQNNLSFYPGILHEDSEFKPRAVYLADKVAFYDRVCYFYLQRQGGNIMSSYSVKRALDTIIVNNNLISFAKNIDGSKCINYFNWLVAMNLNDIFIGYRCLSDNHKLLVINSLKKNRIQFWSMLKSPSFKHKIEGAIFLINIKMALCLHNKLR